MAYFEQGDVGIVTGASSGIGAAIARRVAREGARVALVDLNRAAGETVRAEIEGQGGEAVLVEADVTHWEDVARVTREVLDRWGRIDFLVNCVGIAGRSAPLWEQSNEEWDQVVAVNLNSVFYFCKAVLPAMREQQYGRVVNIASIAGKEGNPNAVAYSATKAAVIGLTKAVAKEVAKDGILVNSVAPAVIMTPLLEQVSKEHVEYMLTRIPMGRPGQPDEVASLVAWLCSREVSFSTGACYDISGGRATY